MITVLGASGFIGSHLVRRLAELGIPHDAPPRDENRPRQNCGHIIYCIGLTADFRVRPFDTVQAHVCKLMQVLRDWEFDSLLYLSSTRLYGNELKTANEEDGFRFNPSNPSDLYNLSKAMGESITLSCGRKTHVARLSNVYGEDLKSDNFLPSVIGDALIKRKVVLQTARDSAKDYISISVAVQGLIDIATRGSERIYNLASGVNVSNGQLLQELSRVTRCEVEFLPEAKIINFPVIDISRMRTEFGFQSSDVLSDLEGLVDFYRRHGDSGDHD
jgi:nucleoside-diphosphate-sugar epimerase